MTPELKAMLIVGGPVLLFLLGLFVKVMFFDDDEDEEC